MPLDGGLVKEFFKYVLRGECDKAQPMIKRIENELKLSDWKLGYLNAMKGLLLSMRGRASKPYASRRLTDEEFARKCLSKLESLSSIENPLLDDFDRGYFRCWIDFLKSTLNSQK